MLSLVTDILPIAPGVCAPTTTTTRRATHLAGVCRPELGVRSKAGSAEAGALTVLSVDACAGNTHDDTPLPHREAAGEGSKDRALQDRAFHPHPTLPLRGGGVYPCPSLPLREGGVLKATPVAGEPPGGSCFHERHSGGDGREVHRALSDTLLPCGEGAGGGLSGGALHPHPALPLGRIGACSRPAPLVGGERGCSSLPLEEIRAGEFAAWTPRNPRLAQLAEQIRRLQQRGHGPPAHCPSGLPALDAALGGGFALAAVHELIAVDDGVAACSVALRAATRAAGDHKWIVYIDTRGDLYPPGVAQLGVPLGRLLIVRATRAADALWVGEQTLRCRAVAAVVLPLRTLDAYTSRRLQLAAEAGRGLGLLIRRDASGGPTFAASRVRLEALVGAGAGRCLRATVLKLREGRPGGASIVELPDAADVVPVHAVSADGAGAPLRRASG